METYVFASKPKLDDLQLEVNKMIDKGYEPVGNILSDGKTHHQPMLKAKKTKNIPWSAIFTLLGIAIGAYLSYLSSYNLFVRQKVFDNQRISYSKLMASKVPWTQSVQNLVESKLLMAYYNTKFNLISHDQKDTDAADRENQKGLALVSEMSNEQKEVFENLGLIQTCFRIDESLQLAIDSIFNYRSVIVPQFPTTFKSLNELDAYYNQEHNNIAVAINEEYNLRIGKLLALLKKQLAKSD
jgi:hypothetical protein